jgi:hypothetical protein
MLMHEPQSKFSVGPQNHGPMISAPGPFEKMKAIWKYSVQHGGAEFTQVIPALFENFDAIRCNADIEQNEQDMRL